MIGNERPYLPALQTERIELRKLTMDDAEEMFEYAQDPEVAKYTTWDVHQTLDDTKRYIEFVIRRYQEKKPADWGLVLRSSNQLIGTLGFVNWSFSQNRAEIGYALSRSFWNQGLLTEAAKVVIRHGFDDLLLNRIEAKALTENIGSSRVMEKIGMTFEGILREYLYVKGNYHDLKLYAILKKDYHE